MQNGSHSEQTYPLDKMPPLMPRKKKVTNHAVSYYIGYNSLQRQVEKHRYKKKQRQWNQKLVERND